MLSGSSPQLLDLALRMPQHTVDVEGIGVGADLGCNSGGQAGEGGGQGLAQTEAPLEARKGNLDLLPYPTPPLARSPARSPPRPLLAPDPRCGRRGPQRELAHEIFVQVRLDQEFFDQGEIRHVSGGKFVAHRHPVGSANQVQLDPVDAKRSPPHPRGSAKSRALRNLSRGCNTESKVESTSRVSGSPTSSGTIPRRRGSILSA